MGHTISACLRRLLSRLLRHVSKEILDCNNAYVIFRLVSKCRSELAENARNLRRKPTASRRNSRVQ